MGTKQGSALFLSLMLAAPAISQEKLTVKKLVGPNDALALAVMDCSAQPPSAYRYMRYIWVDDEDSVKLGSLTTNIISRATVIRRPEPIGTGKRMTGWASWSDGMILLRIDLRHYAPRDLKEWTEAWEDFQFDPRLNLIVTKGTLRIAAEQFPDMKGRGFVTRLKSVEPLITVPPYVKDGQTYTQKWTQKLVTEVVEARLADLKDVELLRIPGPFLDQGLLSQLVGMTGSQAPLVTGDYFQARALSAIQDKGVYATIFGGMYYKLAGIKRGAKKGTDEDVLLQDLGVGNIELGITARKIFDSLRSDQRVALFRSQVTGSPRRVDFFRTLAGRLDLASGLISVTHDLRSQDIDIDTHPIANLLDFQDFAREVIYERPNGLHGYALFNNKGALQDEVPPDVAKDHTISPPHTARLQPAISCIACHEAEGSDGWKKAPNDVQRLINAKVGLDVFGDGYEPVDDVLDRLAGLYSGDTERALLRGRDDYAAAVMKATGPWKSSKKGQTDVVKQATSRLVDRLRKYTNGLVDQKVALQELGIEGDEKTLAILLTPDSKTKVIGPDGNWIIPEDPRLGALRAGLSISRADWSLIYAYAYARATSNMNKLVEKN